jgi:pyruvate formate lyase activating enzyme
MSANTIKVGGAETFSLVDFPDKISAVIFMQGCPWRCPFCHNAFLQDFQYDSGFIWDKFIKFLETRRNILDGVVFSGGEPLVQDNLAQAIQEVKSLGFKIGLHTGGYRPEHLQKILPLLDWVGLDIKAPLNAEQYAKATGVAPAAQIENIKKSLQMLIDSGIDFECRTTCDPRILSIEDIKTIGDELSSLGVAKYYLQKYRPIESDKTTSDSDCEKFFRNKDLLQYLQSKFQVFDIRK